MIVKRTFEAAKHPAGSPERAKLNLDGATSEFFPSYKYIVRAPGFTQAVRTKAEAESVHAQLTPERRRA